MKPSLSLIIAGLVAGTTVAVADPDPGAPPADPPATGSASVSGGVASAPGVWGFEMDSRPLTLPKGKLGIDVAVPFVAVTVTDPLTGDSSTSLGIGAMAGATYGVSDKLEVGGAYFFSLKDFDATGTLAAHASLSVMHSDKLDVAVNGLFAFDLHSSGTALAAVGVTARYHLAPKLSLFTGNPSQPFGTFGIGELFGSTPVQLAFGLNNGNAVNLTLPVGVGYQATPNVYLFGGTTIANIELNPNSNQAFIFSDFIPINVGAFYSMDKLDIGATFSDDLKNAGDFYLFSVVGRYYVK